MELSLILSDETETYQAILGQFIESSAAETHADRILAQQAAETATNSANSALDSAGQAAQSAAASADSATQASTSAAAASTSEQHASQYATAAQAASTDAAGSASSAAGSASSAAVSATNAANSATAASISEQNAAATLANALKKANNLSDVADAATALANLGGAPKASPTFIGNVGVPTRTAGDSTDNAASTKFVATGFLPRTGGVPMTGNLPINAPDTAHILGVVWQLAGTNRWSLQSNINSAFTLSKYNADGSWNYDPVVVGQNGAVQLSVRSGGWCQVLSDNVYSVLSLVTANGFCMQMRASQNVGTEWVNSANTAVNMTLYDGGDLLVRGNVTAYSDRRVKSNIKRIKGAMAKVRELVGVTFTRRRSEDKTRHMGFIAQDVEPIVPEVVRTDEKGMKSIAYANMTALLAEALKELDERVAALEAGE
ncbi:tail fiber domain-containing protein [Burkholderia multivorans]|uniref:tail fiber domain-containing protein n=1 Tax=Burkholderia multivorans TaxID=87883 RepID=UPI002019E982|nr:tail fiber domain-containing protein [Burkholderia multivorans]MCL4651640.1 tail fiber domain-containing protein [Burkholderia multivorans]MCL4655137.1 tail fiber domain-containing protein [Burkholderia multivorans]MCO1426146.1 tail fiber domain-containing protein [Burkholderia multivorans]UQN51193.1 tail fiber domain-containing protein [Burkholderia multivorans]UQN84456.1 tail fiber domain-containing protein [Burkholderia multivorans]